jgi:hypothetical protein
MDHMVWVPAHELEKRYDEAEAVRNLIKYEKVGGWYGFCGRPSHVPRGLSIRHGKEREGGKVVRLILDHEKKPGLESFQRWEVGAIENNFETNWDTKRYALSCSFAPIMTIIATMYQSGKDPATFLERLFESAFRAFGSKKPAFFFETWEDFVKAVGSSPEKDSLIKYTCSRCAVIPCLNRQTPFYDNKLLKKIAREPELLPNQ